MQHLKIGNKSDAITVVIATMMFQYGGYLRFKLILLENKFSDPHPRFLF